MVGRKKVLAYLPWFGILIATHKLCIPNLYLSELHLFHISLVITHGTFIIFHKRKRIQIASVLWKYSGNANISSLQPTVMNKYRQNPAIFHYVWCPFD